MGSRSGSDSSRTALILRCDLDYAQAPSITALPSLAEASWLAVLVLQHELPGVEFKSPGPRGERALFHSVVRAVLGMANRRDGGRIVLGLREGPWRQTGAGWTDR
jgi:hypothetical protein